jgi:hypothetical protein
MLGRRPRPSIYDVSCAGRFVFDRSPLCHVAVTAAVNGDAIGARAAGLSEERFAGSGSQRGRPYPVLVPDHLWTALRWAAAARHQAERVLASLKPYLEYRWFDIGVGTTTRVTPDMERPAAIFWSDVHFLMIAVNHLDGALAKRGTTGTPRLDRDLRAKAVELRHLLEHWPDAAQGKGAWKGYREKHGEIAGPAQLSYEPGNPPLLTIGADPLSINDLNADLRRVESELIEIEART